MDSPARHLQMAIRKIALLSRSFDGSAESINIIQSIVNNFDSRIFQRLIPGRISRVIQTLRKETSGIRYADVYQDDYCHVNTFGLLKSGLKIPLHDHPNQHAVMKVYQGSVKIRSFSIIDCDESDDDDEGGGAASSSSASPVRVRYEGEIVLSSGSEQQHSAVLGPRNGNIHEVTSLEPHTYFCDFFIANSPNCNYYRVDESSEPLVAGKSAILNRIRCPSDFYCDIMDFPSFEKFD
ncbi:Cysteine dioxygenase [Caenorhabditis elegans]|uniref:Cysteine dioxygenase n=1 Tax=Caenorhabditis elegans TaxID=6239 RepID=Q8IAA1_CAEEL|nr:Cysteine dioxygenase [Caenorhabditis elegans]CCD72445.1 Cysteine dioxygenase [Caenorhabditis elegans]|eukprot:NP_741508.2 Uncharacterized protein CELE_Y50D4C.6 [Caenorhabditis elegans]